MARSNMFSTSMNVLNVTNAFFSIIVMYFIYLFAAEKSTPAWHFLGTIAKIYLIVIVGIFALFILFIIIFTLAGLGYWFSFMRRRR